MSVNRDANNRKKVKSKINSFGSESRPRLSIFRSNEHIYIQAIDDEKGRTLASASSLKVKEGKMGKSEKSTQVGKSLAEQLKKLNVEKAVFDRGAYRYHGRVKALADSIREGGIKF